MIVHVQCHKSRQNSPDISSKFSKDDVSSSSFVRNIYIETISDIVIGQESSDVLVQRRKYDK